MLKILMCCLAAFGGLAMPAAAQDDPYLWLEEVEGERALGYVEALNAVSLPQLEAQPGFAANQAAILEQLNAPDRITYARFRGDMVYNFWQDETHVRGLIRRAPLKTYLAGSPQWEPVLDIDALAKAEEANWVYKGLDCLAPGYRRCIISLSPGGTDAIELREFDLETKSFIDDGFRLSAAKTWFAWYDENALLIGSDFGPESQTESGYPRTQRLWKRGTPVESAQQVFEIDTADLGASPAGVHTKEGARRYLSNVTTFWTAETYAYEAGQSPVKLSLPKDANIVDYGTDRILALMRSPWKGFPAGALIAFDVADAVVGGDGQPQLIFAPQRNQAIEAVTAAGRSIYVALLEDVAAKLLRFTASDGSWTSQSVALPGNGALRIIDADADSDQLFVEFESFTQPSSLFHVREGEARVIQTLPARFDGDAMVAQQYFARSADGTSVPYFFVRSKAGQDGPVPVWLHGYGGFEVSETPSYLAAQHQLWLQSGGAFALANIRGGGEYGPRWHQAALLKNRHKAYEDMAAIADDMVARGLTTAPQLGVSGRSNGGLLTGVMLTRYWEKFGAVIIGVPLLDMLRYDKLPAGASWTGEYGDPDDADMHAYLKTYSPYQNMSADEAYPETFIYTSTKDDRVHPGHARKFAARLAELNQPFLYYENIEGGHAGVSNRKQAAYRAALELSFMTRRLMPPTNPPSAAK